MRIHKYLMFHKNFRVKLYLLCSLIFALFLCTLQTLFADISTLERIAEAEREVSYVGIRLKTFIWSRGTRAFEEYIIHKPGDTSYRKVVSVVGERRSLGTSQDGNEHRRDNRRRGGDENNRDNREREQERSRWRQVKSPFSKKEIELIAQNYNIEKRPSGEKIADYDIDILTISPKFAGRPTKHLFYARENGIILRVEDLDAEGVLREMSVYTRISFDPETVERKWQDSEKEIKQGPQRSYSISLTEAEKIIGTQPIQPAYLPPGFQLQDVHSIKDRKNTIHLIYTDGLLGFSMFETTRNQAHRGSRRGEETEVIDGTPVRKRQRGPTYTFSWTATDIHFYLFGAMPASEMQKVVESIIHEANKK